MKNEIDDLLNGIFRNGRLQGKGGEKEAPKPVDHIAASEDAISRAAENSAQAQIAMEKAETARRALSEALGESIESLTRAAQADLSDLESHLRKDGADESLPTANPGNPKDIDAAFEKAHEEAALAVLGQEDFLSQLEIALRRPFVAGVDTGAPMARAAVIGKAGTGRHKAIESFVQSLGRQGVLRSPKIAKIDLSSYTAPDSEKLFFQDFYSAVKSGAAVILFENYESCSTAVLSLVAALFRTGELPLPGRYAEQKGMLIDIGSALAPGAVSSLSGAGRYLFLVTEKSKAKLADAFGGPFVSALDDICTTGEFSEESLTKIAHTLLDELTKKAKDKLGFTLTFGEEEAAALAGHFSPYEGVEAMESEADRLYKALSEVKLRRRLGEAEGKLIAKDGALTAQLSGEDITLGEEKEASAGAQAVEEVKKDLEKIVGLSTVKEYILSLEDNFKIQQLRKEKGLKADSPSMHMIFTGNPGTGKTTMARIVSRYLKAIGVLTGGQLVEVTRADLVGKYVGHTAPLTEKAIESALGGVLFVDEAYSLFRGKDDSFGLEAIDALVKGMEDNRDSLVVILAGYSKEMEEFLTANSGLRSRFPNIIEFPDYTADELLKIAQSIVKEKGYRMEKSCEKPLLSWFSQMQSSGDPRTNGNGRMARNKVEEAVIACSRRNVKLPAEKQDLELLLPEDFGFSKE